MTDPRIDPVALTQALIRCESVTPADAGALDVVQGALEGLGFSCHRMTFSEPGTPDTDNLYARIGTAGPNLCFAGHTDVVPAGDEAAWTRPPFSADIADGTIYGRGAVDMKGAVACFIVAAGAYLSERGGKPEGSLSLLITGDEEGPGINGTIKVLDWLKARGEVLDACIVGEPSNPERIGEAIKIGRRGSINGEIVVAGRQGHAAYPERADNPVPKLARIIDRLTAARLDDGNAHFQPSNMEVTVISVPNTVTNIIPAFAKGEFNIRYNDLWTRETLEAWVRERCAEAAGECGAEFTLAFSGSGGVFLTKPGPLVDAMRQAVEAATALTPELSTGGGTSDARFIKDACPVIEFGLVNATIHKVDECVSIADLQTLTDIYRDFIGRYFAAAAGRP